MKTDELKKFIKPGNSLLYIAGAIMLASGFIAYSARETGNPIAALLIGLCITLFIVRFWYSMYKDYISFIKLHQQNDDLDDIGADFSEAKNWFKDTLRTGEKGIYTKGCPELRNYDDVLGFFEFVHSTNNCEDYRYLRAVMKGGEEISFSKLKTFGKSNEELAAFYKFMLNKNPDIVIGYDKAKKLDAVTVKHGRDKTWICECGQKNPISRISCSKCGLERKTTEAEP